MMQALMIAAPTSGSGNTTVTLGLLRALRRQGLDVCGCKVGPDYLEPVSDLGTKIERLADLMIEQIDLDQVIALMRSCQMPALEQSTAAVYTPRRALTIAVAKDAAFAFYYPENLELLATAGRVVYFSPLRDAGLPECDLVYIDGGYPEVFRAERTVNRPMRESIRAYVECGGYLYAECGGLMYLTESIEEADMVGIFRGKTTVTTRLQRFGYVDIMLKTRCLLGELGDPPDRP